MNLYNYNEMFILALVGLSFVGVICFGLLAVVAIFVLRQKRERGQQENNPPSDVNLSSTTAEQILEKLNNIHKEQRKGGALTNASFGFAVAAFVTAVFLILATNPLMITIGSFLILLGLGWCIWNFVKWRHP